MYQYRIYGTLTLRLLRVVELLANVWVKQSCGVEPFLFGSGFRKFKSRISLGSQLRLSSTKLQISFGVSLGNLMMCTTSNLKLSTIVVLTVSSTTGF